MALGVKALKIWTAHAGHMSLSLDWLYFLISDISA